ncbi:MAG: pentapeptide repeat-containing protein [Gammaproteobacteria bacterium]|nr:pentapeptide repeat-containing protein [Gammaproteobacteria bacterium]
MADAKPTPVRTSELRALGEGTLDEVSARVFNGTDFTAADLNGVTFDGCDFIDVGFRRAELTDARFHRCSFFRAEPAASCDFSFANLRDATFERCDLTTAVMQNVRAFGLIMEGCVAGGIDFRGADFTLGRAGAKGLASATFNGCNMPWADFTGVTLSDCKLTGCRLMEAIFNQATLAKANLTGSDICGIEAHGLTLVGADLRGTTFNNLDVRATDLTGAKVRPEQALMLLTPLGIEIDVDDDIGLA